jgi:hypothetical protein
MRVAIVGTGFAGFGAAVALTAMEGNQIEVFDIGLTKRFSGQPDKPIPNAKTCHGSFFTYGVNDNRWRVNLDSRRICSSHAFGGHSTVYSGAVLYPKNEDLTEWPEESKPRAVDYRAVMSHFEVLNEDDSIQSEFPLFPEDTDLQNSQSDDHKVLLGLSRIALMKNPKGVNSDAVEFCTSAYFKELIETEKIIYRSQLYVSKVERVGNKLRLFYEHNNLVGEWSDGFDAVFLGAGCINTTGIVDRTLFGLGTREYKLKSVGGCINAFWRVGLSMSSGHRIRQKRNFPEFFLEIKSPLTSGTWSHTQITAINEQIITAILSKIPFCRSTFAALFRNLRKLFYFAITIKHSRHCKHIPVKCTTKRGENNTFEHTISIDEPDYTENMESFKSAVFQAVKKQWNQLRMIPIPYGSLLADFFRRNRLGGWHYGGTLPMVESPKIGQCHPSGEVAGVEGLFVVDSAGFPEVPGSTVALLIAANSHRIALDWLVKSNKLKKKTSCQ